MKTGIIILNYNDAQNTIKMLKQIQNYKAFSHIIVVDNCSTDDSFERLKAFENEKIILLEVKENKGYASGNNVGLRYLENHTDCELFVISNPDILVEEKSVNQLIKDFKQDTTISFLGPTILERGNRIRGWKLPTYFVEVLQTLNFFHRFAKPFLFYDDSYYQDRIVNVQVIHGSFFMGRLKDFQKLGYFDENTFLYYEENILGKKAFQQNMKICVDQEVEVIHALSVSVDKSLRKIKKYKILKQSMFYYEKTYNHLRGIKFYLLKFLYYLSLLVAYITFWI